MNIAVVGTGYVGLVTGVAFAEMGNTVTCIDVDANKISRLKNGEVTIYEPGLEELFINNIKSGRLHFTTELKDIINDVDVVFSAVGTPPDEDGSADLKYVLQVANTVGSYANKEIILVTKSTVPVGTAKKVYEVARKAMDDRGLNNVKLHVASNPEFLKEGTAVKDVLNPERIVIGVNTDYAKDMLTELYRPFNLSNDKMIITDIPSAEMIKYASNSMLATRISFMNELANLCEVVGANVDMVRKGMGTDSRIGSKFLYAGCGYGGSCFPKDVKALIHTGYENGIDLTVLKSVDDANNAQKRIPFSKLCKLLGTSDLTGKIITVWGLAFKPDTDDMREATALTLIDQLKKAGAYVKVYDPIAMNECKRRLIDVDGIYYANDMYDAAKDSDGIVLVTEWKEFRTVDWNKLMSLINTPVIVDGRNLYDRTIVEKSGFYYSGIGK